MRNPVVRGRLGARRGKDQFRRTRLACQRSKQGPRGDDQTQLARWLPGQQLGSAATTQVDTELALSRDRRNTRSSVVAGLSAPTGRQRAITAG
jgi:hypothetical protein